MAESPTTWGTRELQDIQHDVHDEIFATVARLREQHLERSEAIRAGLERVRASRAAQSGDPGQPARRTRRHAGRGSIIRMSPVTTPSFSGERVMQLTLQRIALPRRFTASSVIC